MSLAVMLVGAALAGSSSSGEPVRKTLPAGMPSLELASFHGSVLVRRDANASQTLLYANPRGWAEDCDLEFGGDAQNARAEVTRGRALSRCTTDFELVLAGDTQVDISMRSGQVTLQELDSAVAVDLGRGSVWLDGARGPLDLRVDSGRIRGDSASQELVASVGLGKLRLEGLEHGVQARVGVGGMRLDFEQAMPGTVDARVALGRIRARFPYGVYLDNQSRSPVGVVRSAIPHRNAADTTVQARASVGAVRVETILDHEQPQDGQVAGR